MSFSITSVSSTCSGSGDDMDAAKLRITTSRPCPVLSASSNAGLPKEGNLRT